MSPKIVVDMVESIRGEVSVTQACEWLEVPRVYLLSLESGVSDREIDVMVQKVRELCLQHKSVMVTVRLRLYFEGIIGSITSAFNGLCNVRGCNVV